MALALVSIVKEFDGEEWENVYCVGSGDNDDIGFTELDWNGYTGTIPINAAETNPASASAGTLSGDSIIHSLIALERLLHFDVVNFKRLFAWDGQENGVFSTFAAVPLNFAGLVPQPGGGIPDIAPGGISWLVNKTPAVFGSRAGRSYYRLCFGDAAVKPGGRSLLDWTSPTAAAAQAAVLAGAITSSGIDNFFFGATNTASSELMIPRYTARVPGVPGSGGVLVAAAPIAALTSQRPVLRQVKRGRKRPAA